MKHNDLENRALITLVESLDFEDDSSDEDEDEESEDIRQRIPSVSED